MIPEQVCDVKGGLQSAFRYKKPLSYNLVVEIDPIPIKDVSDGMTFRIQKSNHSWCKRWLVIL
eukprot:snap_masked-scaffold_61-processed-gene-0.26-mRNA-1 protein AED:1.00 eAED:1.00 QI:0/0/0/0/1/1/2/0/62